MRALPLLGLLLLPPAAAQSLRLDLRGGSLPGPIDMALRNGQIGLLGAIILSASPGPTPLFLIDPPDSRSLDVGVELIGSAITGVFGPSGSIVVPTIAMPNNPAFVGAAIFTQGISVPGVATIVSQISNPAPFRLAPANAFHDRRTQFTTPRAFFPVLPMADHRWLIAGGGSGGLLAQVAQKTTEVYDPLTDAFTAGPSMNYEHALHTATLLNDGRWLLSCGVDRLNDPKTDCEVYVPSTDTFVNVAQSKDKRMGHTATKLANGKVLMTGGMSDLNTTTSQLDPIFSTLKTTEIYDPTTDTWTRGPDMSIPRAGHQAILLPDGRVLLCGGISWYTLLTIKIPTIATQTEIYNPNVTPPTLTQGPSMSTGHAIFTSVEIAAGTYLIAGGVNALSLTNQGTPTAVAEIYTANAGTGTWSSAGSMSKARGLHAVFGLGGGKYLHVGGADGQITNPNSLSSTEIYDVTSNSWSSGPTLTMSRSGFGFFEAPTGQIHILGGGSGMSSPTVNFTEWYYR